MANGLNFDLGNLGLPEGYAPPPVANPEMIVVSRNGSYEEGYTVDPNGNIIFGYRKPGTGFIARDLALTPELRAQIMARGPGGGPGADAQQREMDILSEMLGLSQEQAQYAREYSEWLKGQLTPIAGQQSKLAKQVAGISKDYLKETTPLRLALTGSVERRLGLPVSNKEGLYSPVAFMGPRAPEREALEAQFGRAREEAISTSGARGGQLSQTLMRLPQERARAVGDLEAAATAEALDAGMKIGQGGLPTALQGMGAASGMYGNAAGTLAQVPQTNLTGAIAGMGSAASGFGGIADRAQSARLTAMGLAQQERMSGNAAQAGKKQGTGQAAGSLLGMALGSAAGPIGTAAGSRLGGWFGGAAAGR